MYPFLSTAEKYLPLPEYPAMVKLRLQMRLQELRRQLPGSILLNGVDITNYSIRKRTLEGISYIPEDRQSCGLVMDFTLEENLGLKNYFREPFSHKGVLDKAEFSQYGNELIDRYDIRSSQGNKTIVRSMSGGNQQRAIIGREIELQSPLMICAANQRSGYRSHRKYP